MTKIMISSLLLLLSCSFAWSQEKNPLLLDQTGLRWVLPFPAARQQAARDKRLLMIKPVAFGTSRDGGW